MNLINRLKRLERDLNIIENDVYTHVGNPCFSLYGAEAKAYIDQEQAAGRLLNPTVIDGISVHRKYTLYLPPDWEGDKQC